MVIGQTIPELTIPKVFESTERSVTYYTAVKNTSNISGAVELTYPTSVTKNIIFIRGDKRHDFGIEGLYERADAIVFARASEGVTKDDKFIVDGDTYIIQVMEKVEYRNVYYFSRGIAIKI